MKLPNADLAHVEHEKIAGYLLNMRHVYGASKARFFVEFGFRVDDPEQLGAALRDHGQRHEVVRTKLTPFGPRYEVEGAIRVPDGRAPRIRTVCRAVSSETH